MSEYIEREALLRALSKEVEYDDDGEQEINSDTVFITIEGFPAADVAEVVHGRWVQDGAFDEDENVYTCSACGEPWTLDAGTPADNNMHYCPNCGAEMKGEQT